MMHYIKTVMISCLLSMLIICSQGYQFTDGDEKLMMVDLLSYLDKYKEYNDSGGHQDNTQKCICSASIKECTCATFKDALAHVENNTIIAINNETNIVSSNFKLSNIFNLSITGYHMVVEIICRNNTSIEFESCNNTMIENITWNECGYNVDKRVKIDSLNNNNYYDQRFDDDFSNYYFFGLSFAFCENITLKFCTFKNSMIGFDTVSDTVYMGHLHFISNDTRGDSFDTSLATGFVINQTNDTAVNNNLVVKVTNSLFTQTEDNEALLLTYIFVNDPSSTIKVFVIQTNFSSVSYDPGWAAINGMVWIRILSSRNAYIKFYGVKFHFNNFTFHKASYPNIAATLLRIYIKSSYKYKETGFVFSRGISGYEFDILSNVTIESCSFLNNDVRTIAHLAGDMYLDVINTSFSNNKATDSIFLVITNNHDDIFGTVTHVITTAIQILQSIFFNNSCGHLISINGIYILAKISDALITHNDILAGHDGLVAFLNYDTLVANITNIVFELNCIKGESAGFIFVSRQIKFHPQLRYGRSISHRSIIYFASIPPNFQFVAPTTICPYRKHCFRADYQQFSFTNGSFVNNTNEGNGAIIHVVVPEFSYNYDANSDNMISRCIFNNNTAFNSLIYVSVNTSWDATLIVKDSVFVRNEGIALNVQNQIVKFLNDNGYTLFEDNRHQSGGASLFLDLNSKVIFTNNSKVSFINNIARRYGGAIYYNITQSSDACNNNLSTFIVDDDNTIINFKNNIAGVAGNSIYFSISQSCNGTLQYDEQTPVFSQLIGEIATSPNKLKFYHPAKLSNSTDPSTYSISDMMLGENIVIPGCVLGHDDNPAGSIQFTVKLIEDNEQNITIQGSDLISVDCKTLQGINDLIVIGSPTLNETIKIQLNSFYDSTFDWKPITVNLNVQLSSCHLGFYYSSDVEYCVCYTTDNIVTCSGSNSTIRNGYWFGTVNDQPTVAICPINYCNFDNCEATTGTCDLHPLRDNQCRTHRSGAACGNCEEGYTLSFDSIECIDIDSCTIGQTALVITISFLYWITFTAVVFGMMYFKIGIGYLYGISFYYSVIDIVMGNTSLFSKYLYQVINTLSSVAKMLPQFIGQLCVVKGLSGIDQQFIHYLHPFAVLLVLVVISISTRFSRRLSLFVS